MERIAVIILAMAALSCNDSVYNYIMDGDESSIIYNDGDETEFEFEDESVVEDDPEVSLDGDESEIEFAIEEAEEEVPNYCNSYTGHNTCCQLGDPCDLKENGRCDCIAYCPWDYIDCRYIPDGDEESKIEAEVAEIVDGDPEIETDFERPTPCHGACDVEDWLEFCFGDGVCACINGQQRTIQCRDYCDSLGFGEMYAICKTHDYSAVSTCLCVDDPDINGGFCSDANPQCNGDTLFVCIESEWEWWNCTDFCTEQGFDGSTGCSFDASHGIDSCECY